mgnify:CR=1 FL=1
MAQVRIGPRVELRVEPPVRAVLVDLVVVTVASMLFGSAIGLITNALDRRIRQHAPRAVGAALFALAAAAAFFPFWLNWQVRASFMVFFATASHGVLIFFKTVEVLCGTLPAGLDRSLRAWVVYFACDAEMKFAAVERAGAGAREEENDAASSQAKHRRHAPGPLPSPPLLRVLPELCVRVAGFMALQSALLHVGALCDWRPFRPRLGAVGSVLDVYFWATLLWACAEWVTALARIALHLCGFDSIAAFRLPLFRSTSPREFWSKRWNLIIHKLMHRTYFAPVRAAPPTCAAELWPHPAHAVSARQVTCAHAPSVPQVARATGSPTLGALSAFVASALFHEYMCARQRLHGGRPKHGRGWPRRACADHAQSARGAPPQVGCRRAPARKGRDGHRRGDALLLRTVRSLLPRTARCGHAAKAVCRARVAAAARRQGCVHGLADLLVWRILLRQFAARGHVFVDAGHACARDHHNRRAQLERTACRGRVVWVSPRKARMTPGGRFRRSSPGVVHMRGG